MSNQNDNVNETNNNYNEGNTMDNEDVVYSHENAKSTQELIETELIYGVSSNQGGAMERLRDIEYAERHRNVMGKFIPYRNEQLLNKFTVPVVTDESGRIAMALAMEQLQVYVSTSEKRLKMENLTTMYKRYYTRLYNEFNILENKPLTKTSVKLVTVFDVFVQKKDSLIHKDKVTIELKEFEWMLKQGRINGNNNKSRIYGYSDMSDYTIEDFAYGDLHIEIGRGIYEVITEDQFITSKTRNMGNAEEIQYRMNSEIIYGRAQELYGDQDESDVEGLIAEQEKLSNPTEVRGYDYREQKEVEYHYYRIRARFNQGFTSKKQLFDFTAGLLFPKRLKVVVDGIEHTTVKKYWTLPVNCLTQAMREEFKADAKHAAQTLDTQPKPIKVMEYKDQLQAKALIERFKTLNGITYESVKASFSKEEAALLVDYAYKVARLHPTVFKALNDKRLS